MNRLKGTPYKSGVLKVEPTGRHSPNTSYVLERETFSTPVILWAITSRPAAFSQLERFDKSLFRGDSRFTGTTPSYRPKKVAVSRWSIRLAVKGYRSESSFFRPPNPHPVQGSAEVGRAVEESVGWFLSPEGQKVVDYHHQLSSSTSCWPSGVCSFVIRPSPLPPPSEAAAGAQPCQQGRRLVVVLSDKRFAYRLGIHLSSSC